MVSDGSLPSRIFESLPKDGSPRNRYEIQSELDVEDQHFMEARDLLIDEGVIAATRGRGGPLRRIVQEEEPAEPERQSEAALYEPLGDVINGPWARDRRYAGWVLVTTARQGRRRTGGTWSRPDLVLVATRRFTHVPGRQLEVITFEVKPPDYFDVTAVYEALAHKQRAHMSYVLACSSVAPDAVDPAIREAAERHGIGVIVAERPEDSRHGQRWCALKGRYRIWSCSTNS